MKGMLPRMIVALGMLVTSPIYSQNIQAMPPTEGFLFVANECRMTLVDMKNGGHMATDNTSALEVLCQLNRDKPFEVICAFRERGQEKPLAVKTMAVGINGGELYVQDAGDSFIANLTSQLYYSEGNMILLNGLRRGRNIFSGTFYWEHEIKKNEPQPPTPQGQPAVPQKTADADKLLRT